MRVKCWNVAGVSAMLFAVAAGAAMAAGAAVAAGAAECGASEPCVVDKGFYLMRPPAGWDGKSALPTAVFFHGYGASAIDVMGDEGLVKTLSDLGVLLVAPDGNDKRWSYPAKIQGPRDDFAFVDAVLDDVERRMPVDLSRLWATGFSIGGSMVWYLACYRGERFAAFAPVAGAYWDPMPASCPSGPVSLLHIHGLTDKTVPMGGRALRGGQFRQGDVMKSLAQLRERDGCPAEPSKTSVDATFACQTWSADVCASKREIELCLHKGEHEIDPAWIAQDYKWVDGLAKAAGK